MWAFLAKECGKVLATSSSDLVLQNLQRVMKEKFAESMSLTGVPEKLGGAICLQVGTALLNSIGEIISHSSPSQRIRPHHGQDVEAASNVATARTKKSLLTPSNQSHQTRGI